VDALFHQLLLNGDLDRSSGLGKGRLTELDDDLDERP
jgi:hypothetical protein